jgi:ATP-dependent RNA helicase DDX35
MSPEEAAVVSLEGRMYPVEVAYLCEPTPDYVGKAAEVAWNINLQVCTGFLCCDEYRLKGG